MGTAESSQFSQKIEQQYHFFQSHQDPHFGHCSLYRNNLNPNFFVIEINQDLPFQHTDDWEKSLMSLKSHYINEGSNVPFLKILHWKISSKENIIGNKIVSTCKTPHVTVWVEFLRHNLKDFIHWRKSQQRPLSMNEVIMSLNKALNAYEMTKNNKFFGLSLNLEDIAVSIEGCIKFNPLMSKMSVASYLGQNNGRQSKSCQNYILQQKIIQKRTMKSQKQNTPYHSLYAHENTEYRFLSPIVSQDKEFLSQLKKFANELVWDTSAYIFNAKNPEQCQFYQRKETKRFLNQLHRLQTIKQVKNFLGESKIDNFFVDFTKLKHEESQEKFSRILSQIEEKSQKTDYSIHESIHVSPMKKYSIKGLQNSLNQQTQIQQFITPEYYYFS